MDVLAVRLEDLNQCASKAFEEFLGVDNLPIINGNIGSQKDYAEIYGLDKDSIVLPQSYLDKLYLSKFAQYFYAENEISKFRARWSTRG